MKEQDKQIIVSEIEDTMQEIRNLLTYINKTPAAALPEDTNTRICIEDLEDVIIEIYRELGLGAQESNV